MNNHRGQGGGPPKRLKASQQQDLFHYLHQHQQAHWSSAQLGTLLQERYGVVYSKGYLAVVLRALGLKYYKPQPQDPHRSPEAEAALTQRLKATFAALQQMGYALEEVAFGFADESSQQTYANSARFWSLGYAPQVVNTSRNRVNTFGFYALQGNNYCQQLSSSSAESFLEVLPKLRAVNQTFKAIVLFWDNLPAHKVSKVEQLARQHQIFLVYNMPYAPDLNPIEKIWKQIKRVISVKGWIQSREQLKGIVEDTFYQLASQFSFANAWIERFLTKVLPGNSTICRCKNFP